MQRKRKQRPPELRRSKGGYDSGFERVLHQTVLKEWEHHSDNIEYVIKHKYEPDFIRKFADKTILIEAKGRFWDHAEYTKQLRKERMGQEEATQNGLSPVSLDGIPQIQSLMSG